MNIDDIYKSGSEKLKAEDLNGQTVPLTIEGVEVVDFGEQGKPEPKLVLSFVGKEKTLVLNRTNAQTIAAQLGSDSDQWLGHPIKIYPTKTSFGGKTVDCIRVKEEAPAEAPAGDIPF